MDYHGFNCHSGPTFVVDEPGETYLSFYYDSGSGTTTRAGITFSLSAGLDGRDRDRLVDRRLAAIIVAPNAGPPATLTVTLAEGVGTYKLWLALGDEGYASANQKVVIRDGVDGPILLTVAGSTSAARRWFDAKNVERDLTGWPQYAKGGANEAAGAALLTFTTTTMIVEFGGSGAGGNTALSHVSWEKVPTVGPTINTQPTNQTVAAGATFTFSVSATASAGTLTFQWRKNGFNISGANTASYSGVAGVDGVSGDVFDCQINDTNGSVTTTNATLTVTSGVSTGLIYYRMKGNPNV